MGKIHLPATPGRPTLLPELDWPCCHQRVVLPLDTSRPPAQPPQGHGRAERPHGTTVGRTLPMWRGRREHPVPLPDCLPSAGGTVRAASTVREPRVQKKLYSIILQSTILESIIIYESIDRS